MKLPFGGFCVLNLELVRRRQILSAWREERPNESIMKTISPCEIMPRVFVCFCEHVSIHQIEYNFAEVLASTDPPIIQERDRHRSILIDSELPDALQQLLAGDVAYRSTLLLCEFFLSMVKSLPNKKIRLALVPRILGYDFFEHIIEFNTLHNALTVMSGRRLRRLRAPHHFDGEASQQECGRDPQHPLFLPRQAMHCRTLHCADPQDNIGVQNLIAMFFTVMRHSEKRSAVFRIPKVSKAKPHPSP